MIFFFVRHLIIGACVLVFLFVSAPPALAWVPSSLQQYTVWNQFDATVNTFHRMGLIMSDAGYQTLFFGIIVLGIVIGGAVAIARSLFSGKTHSWDIIRWFGVVMMGVIIYLTFIRPTTQITVYDEVLNSTQTIGGVPEGIVMLAGLSNTIEKGFVDLIWTSGIPESFRENAGGLTWSILDRAFSGGVDLAGGDPNGQYINMSLRRYIEDCVFFEIAKPGSTLDINSLNTTPDLRNQLAMAVNPAIWTVWYDAANRSGVTLTCTQAWTNLSAYLNGLHNTAPAVDKFWEERCGEAGLGAHSAAGGGTNLVSICRQKAENMAASILGSSFSSAHLFRQYLISSAMWDVYTTYSPTSAISSLSSRATGNSMMGMGIMANEWIPIIRSVVFSIFIGMAPFICLLIPTPLFGRAMALLFGIFVFLTTWTICDAMVHSFAMDKSFDLFQEITNGSLGFKSMMIFSSSSQKAMAAFGAARWSAIMVAGVFSMLLTKFGGTAMAHFAGNLSAFKQHGAAAAESSMNSSKWASDVNSIANVAPSMAYANTGHGSVMMAKTYDTSAHLQKSVKSVGAFGSGNPQTAADVVSSAGVMSQKENVAHADTVKAFAQAHGKDENQVIRAVENFKTASQGGSAEALQNLSQELNTGPFQAMDLIKDTGLKKEYGDIKGLREAYEFAIKEYGYQRPFTDFIGMQAALQSERRFSDAMAVKKYANHYEGGQTGFLRHQAEYRTGEISGLLGKLRENRLTPGNVGEAIGAMEGVQKMANTKFYQNTGDPGVMITRIGQNYNELGKMLARQAVGDYIKNGRLMADTRAVVREMMHTRAGRDQLRTQGIGNFTVSKDAAPNLGDFLRSGGFEVKDRELENSTVQLNFAPNSDGTLSPTLLVTDKGQKTREFNLREADFRDIQKGQATTAPENTFGGVHLESVTNKTDFGGVLEVSGYDRAGNMRHLFISKNTGKVIEDNISKGPDFAKTNVISMVGQHGLPEEVFSDPGYAIAFANRFAAQWGKEYSGSIKLSKATQTATNLDGKLGFGMKGMRSGIGSGFGLSATRRDLTDSSSISQRDVIYGITKDILTRENWTQQEKAAYLEDLNGNLLQGDFFNPNSLPSNSEMMTAGGLDRKQTPFSEKFQTKEEREKTDLEFKLHPEKFSPIFQSINPPNDDT